MQGGNMTSDICMCRGEDCDMRESCYRYIVSPNDKWQTYFEETPLEKDSSCKYYWPINDV